VRVRQAPPREQQHLHHPREGSKRSCLPRRRVRGHHRAGAGVSCCTTTESGAPTVPTARWVQIGVHAQGDNIEWDQDYDEPQMRDLPTAPCVRTPGRHGIGKTLPSRRHARRAGQRPRSWLSPTADRWPPRSTRTSRSWALSTTNTRGQINDRKVVVCLDSLHRW
jgi:hypothetical protein